MLRLLTITALMLAATPALAQEKPLDGSDADAFVAALGEMGYAPDKLKVEDGRPFTVITDGDNRYVVNFSGCTGTKQCRYLTMVGSFSDVKNAPADWVAKENGDFDLIKVWTAENGALVFATTAVIEGWPRANFRSWMALFNDSRTELARDAVTAKLAK